MVKKLYPITHEKSGSVNNSYFDFRSMIYKATDNSIIRMRNEFLSNEDNYNQQNYSGDSYSQNNTELVFNNQNNTYDDGDIIIADNRTTENSELIKQYDKIVQDIENRTNTVSTENVLNVQELNEAETVNVDVNRAENVENNELLESLNRINIQNEERRQEYQTLINNIEARRKKNRTKKGLKDTQKSALAALNDKEGLMEQLREEQEQEEQEQEEIRREVERLFPDNARRIFEMVSEYYSNNTGEFHTATETNIAVLINNIEQIRRENEEIHQNTVNILQENNTAVETVHRIMNNEGRVSDKKTGMGEENIPEAEIIHRQTERISNEDIEETLNEYRRNISRQIKKEVKEEAENIHSTQTNRVVNNYTTTNQEIELPNINKMVQDRVNAQLGAISEKVYSRLERKMATEKSRRGY